MLIDTRPPRGSGGSAEPWRDEPNRVAWRDPSTGLQCLILRARMGNLCGYVRVPRGHALHGKHCGQRRVERGLSVHGGLSFSGCIGGRYMKRGHWFGFDCGHAFDYVPGLAEVRKLIRDSMPPEFVESLEPFRLGSLGSHEVYRTVSYVRDECTALAEQLARKAGR